MGFIDVRSIQDAVGKGTLIELASDYRTSSTVRACMPKQTTYPFAISSTAFRQYLQLGTPRDKQSRIEGICEFLNHVLGRGEKSVPADLEFRFPGERELPGIYSLRAEWFAPNQYWVILLPDERIAPLLKVA